MLLVKLTKKNLNDVLKFMIDLGYEAGEVILGYQKQRQVLNITHKGAEGIASEADEASEKLILKTIKEKYPKHEILSEEDYSKKSKKTFTGISKKEFLWVVDPLDGTNNFVNGIPIYAVSIGLMHKGKAIAGMVYNPLSGECFFAGKDLGAFLIDFRINPLKKYDLKNKKNDKDMEECIFSPAPVYEHTHKFENQLSAFRKNITGARAVRRLGSAALELCYVANGNFDGYWEKNLKPWDVAAAMLICREAGVKVTDFEGKPYNFLKDSIIAACDPLHSRILGKLK
jgi:myo-inositol-1(or 4)-monophosphatase